MSVAFKFDEEKAVAAVVMIASEGIQGLTKYKICKLLFLADKYHVVRFGRPVTGDRLVAMPYGPVPSSALNLLNEVIENPNCDSALAQSVHLNRVYRNPHFKSLGTMDVHNFLSPSDMVAISATIKDYGDKSFEELKAITHEMAAYKKAWDNRCSNAPPMEYEDLFEEDDDAIEGALEEMVENYRLEHVFGSCSI